MTQSAIDLITFKGEFPDHPLAPARAIAEIIAPYDMLVADHTQPGETLALFELMDLDGCLTETFIRNIPIGAMLLYEFSLGKRNNYTGIREYRRFFQRFNGAIRRIVRNLDEHGYPLVCHFLNEMLAYMQHHEMSTLVSSNGLQKAMAIKREAQTLFRMATHDVSRTDLDVAWFVVAEAAGRQPSTEFGRFQGMPEARDMLKTIDLALSDKYFISTRYQFDRLRLPHLQFCFTATDHPLNICRLVAVDTKTNALYLDAEVTRDNGEIVFSGCNFLSVRSTFVQFGAETAYIYLRDLVTANLYTMLAEGDILERAYVDQWTEEETEQVLVSPSVTAPASALSPEPRTEPPPETETAPEEPEPTTPKNLSAPLLVGKGRFSYRNILAALFRFGVSIERGGRHVKLRIGERTTPFLNRHHRDDPIHNRLNLFRALEALGIPKSEFVRSL